MFTFYYRAKNFCVQDGATIEKPTQGSDIAVRIYELEVDAPPMISYMLVHRNPKEESLRGIQILEKTLSGFLNSVLWSVAYD